MSRVPTVTCREESCRAEFVLVENPESGNRVPVDVDTFDEQEIALMEATGSARDVVFDKARHSNHFLTCKNPNRFSRRKKDRTQ